jgi:16S rRNA G966 N2-methylase RsmD
LIQQVDGYQRTKDKLPTFAKIEDWWYPVRLSCEQCSSELTARYKASLLPKEAFTLTDLTGGYGVDTYFMSQNATEAHYVERDQELCKIVAHNFEQTRPHVHIHNTEALTYLQEMQPNDVIYIDPARRNQYGGKVFRIEDCEPNLIEILDTLRSKSNSIIIKLSPMLDISQALTSLKGNWDVHVLAVKNEVKEILLISYHSRTTSKEYHKEKQGMIYATNLIPTPSQDDFSANTFAFTKDEERDAHCQLYDDTNKYLITPGIYIYEPNAAIIKAGAFKIVAQQYQLCKMSANTHLYLSDKFIKDFPGRVWQIVTTNIKQQKDIRANIMTRNYPLTPEQLRKKLKIKDSDTHTIIGARLGDKPTLFLAERIDQHTTSR